VNAIGYLQFPHLTLPFRLDLTSAAARALLRHLPLLGTAHQLGGEVYFRIQDLEIPYDGTETRDFQKGDVAYWRSPKGEKLFSVAVFYDRTPFGEGPDPVAASPCIRIGQLTADPVALNLLNTITTGETVRLG
jgi:hypothetical protein